MNLMKEGLKPATWQFLAIAPNAAQIWQKITDMHTLAYIFLLKYFAFTRKFGKGIERLVFFTWDHQMSQPVDDFALPDLVNKDVRSDI